MRIKGKRTYGAIAAIVITGALGIVQVGGVAIFSPEVVAALVTILGAGAAYFRRQA